MLSQDLTTPVASYGSFEITQQYGGTVCGNLTVFDDCDEIFAIVNDCEFDLVVEPDEKPVGWNPRRDEILYKEIIALQGIANVKMDRPNLAWVLEKAIEEDDDVAAQLERDYR